MNKKHIINDIIMTSAALFVALVWFLFNTFSGSKSGICNIYLNNELIDTVSLYDSGNYELKLDGRIIKTDISSDTKPDSIICFNINNGYLSVTDANCADKLCAHQPAISRENDSIVCLPQKIVFTVAAGANNTGSKNRTGYEYETGYETGYDTGYETEYDGFTN